MRRTLTALALLLSVPVALAQVYKWTDAGGTVHYSEAPPASGSYQTLRTSGGAQAPVPAASSPPPASAATANAAGDNNKLCTDLQHNMTLLQGADALSVADAKGAQVPMDATRRQQELALARDQYKLNCAK